MNTFSNLKSTVQRALGLQRTGTPEFRRMVRAATRALDAGYPVEAMQILGPFLGYPPTPELDDPAMWHDAMVLFARIVTTLEIDGDLVATIESETTDASPADGDNGLAHLLRRLAERPDDFKALCLAGRVLPGEALTGIGCMLLARASRLAPDDGDVVGDLALYLLDIRAYSDAARVLNDATSSLDTPPRLRYILTWSYLHQGELFKARNQWSRHQPPEDDHDRRVHRKVDGLLQRSEAYEQVGQLNRRDLRGWNFVFNGSFLLHVSPDGAETMNGRYAAIYEVETHCLEGINRLAAVLAACEGMVPRVFMVPDHDSQVLATATAHFLGCELVPWPDDGSEEPGLIVLHNLNTVHPVVLRTLVDHRPGQLLWAHAVSWMNDQPVGPDVITYLYEHTLSPWEERQSDFQSIPSQRTGPIDQLAGAILGAQLRTDALDDLPDLCAWITALPELPPEHAPGAFRSDGTRRIFYADSPVPSASFRDLR